MNVIADDRRFSKLAEIIKVTETRELEIVEKENDEETVRDQPHKSSLMDNHVNRRCTCVFDDDYLRMNVEEQLKKRKKREENSENESVSCGR